MILLAVHPGPEGLLTLRESIAQLPEIETVGHASAVGALEWAEGHDVDLAVVEHAPPALDGPQFIERFRALAGRETAFVVMVARDVDIHTRRRAARAGANELLAQPLDAIELGAHLHNVLLMVENRRKLHERASASLIARELETLMKLARAAEFRDDVTGMHIVRVGHISAALGRSMRLSEHDCDTLAQAAPMHDIGKIAIPDGILLKPGPLTVAEFEIMRRHAAAGFDILKGGDSPILRCAAEIALTHHERFDGTGYPRRLRGLDIPLSGRICAVADVFDALTSVRPYKDAWPPDRAIEFVLQGSGTQFDPDVVAAFHDAYPEICTIRARFEDDPRYRSVSTL